MDERGVAANVKGKGLIVIACGETQCSQACSKQLSRSAADALLRVEPVQDQVVLARRAELVRQRRLFRQRRTRTSGGEGSGIQCVGSQGTPPALSHLVPSQ
jgi:hypothetical protein